MNSKTISKETIKKTNVHRQKANDIGGTNSTPPLATTRLLAIKIGWINNSENEKKFFFELFNLSEINFYRKRLHKSSL